MFTIKLLLYIVYVLLYIVYIIYQKGRYYAYKAFFTLRSFVQEQYVQFVKFLLAILILGYNTYKNGWCDTCEAFFTTSSMRSSSMRYPSQKKLLPNSANKPSLVVRQYALPSYRARLK